MATKMNGEEDMAIDEVAGVRSSDLDCSTVPQWKQVVPGEALWGRTGGGHRSEGDGESSSTEQAVLETDCCLYSALW